MKATRTSVAAAVLMVTSAATAEGKCPRQGPPPDVFGTQGGDQSVDSAFLEKTLAGKKLRFADGVEHYKPDGSYTYSGGGQTWEAPGYRFYDNGLRCIDYPNGPRFDLYVVNDGKLVLVNEGGGRFVGKVTR